VNPAVLVVLAMLRAACPLLSAHDRPIVARAIVATLAEERRLHGRAPSVDLVVAVMAIESGGNVRACANGARRTASRGLMQINAPGWCGDGRHPELYHPRKNTRRGIQILAAWQRATDSEAAALARYSGGTPGYAAKVEAKRRELTR
jgi:hypothetical protein